MALWWGEPFRTVCCPDVPVHPRLAGEPTGTAGPESVSIAGFRLVLGGDVLETIRERGIAFNYEEQLDGIKAVGVPVNGPDNRVVGVFSVVSPANRLTDDQLEKNIPNTLLGVANEFELETLMS